MIRFSQTNSGWPCCGALVFSTTGAAASIPQLQQQNKNAIQQRDAENASRGFVAVRIDVNGKKHNISQQAQASQRSDEPVFGNEIPQKIAERNRRKIQVI
jgi:hypothetical protein